MDLAQALRLSSGQPLLTENLAVAFVGSGGKSTAMFQLARALQSPVVLSATTHLGVWQIPLADKHYIVRTKEDIQNISLSDVTLVTGEIEADRTKGLSPSAISWLHEVCKNNSLPLLIEADGSRQKPLKAPAAHEPAIPGFVDLVVQVVGLTGLGTHLSDEFVQRRKVFGDLCGLATGDVITPEALVRVLTHPEGGLKNIPSNARRVALLNQADSPDLQAQADAIAKDLLSAFHSIIISSLREKRVHAVHEPIAGIILAAGESRRLGQPKQLLDWRGEPFVRVVAKTALEAGLSPVIVVTGAYAGQIESTVRDLPVQVVYNDKWKSGQASSIRAGLSPPSPPQNSTNFGEGVGGAIFLLADQPQLSPTILHALIEEHASTLAPIIAPMVLDQRANPVLFDRVTFSDLMTLEGDVGGRGIFSRHRVTYLPWHDDAMLLDVDTPEHYQRLKDLLE